MERARSASIFCWPRTRFLRREERLTDVLDLEICAAFVAICVLLEVLWCLGVGFLDVDLVVDSSGWRAFAIGTRAQSIAAAMATSTIPRDLKNEVIPRWRARRPPPQPPRTAALPNNTTPNERWHCNHPRLRSTAPVSVGRRYVTEVYPRRRSCHPAGWNRAGEPGRRRPDHSSCWIRCARNLLRCSLVAC